ncbi:MAG: tyrosine-protein phosphatase [Ancalomicrobiaceae bacterium]|nr:tyrosine-protein phosphatase [Ancalomicrobiaceae bacterium]
MTLAVVAGVLLGWAGAIQLTGNIDTVEAGAVYRSAQLSPERLKRLIDEKQLKTVFNLRGAHRGEDWYDAEKKLLNEAGVALVDVPMSAIHQPNPKVLADLVAALKTARKPFLIHCNSGSDRTGLAAALYDLIVRSMSPGEARRQLSFYWGHFPWLGSGTIAMDETFDAVAARR